jgi:hypothetical protein
MPLEDGFKHVDKALKASGFNLSVAVAALLADAAMERAKTTVFGKDECGTGYLPGHVETEAWHISLMLAEYLAWLLGEKVKDGHCKNHKPCDTMRAEHKRMLAAFRAALDCVVSEIGQLEKHL